MRGVVRNSETIHRSQGVIQEPPGCIGKLQKRGNTRIIDGVLIPDVNVVGHHRVRGGESAKFHKDSQQLSFINMPQVVVDDFTRLVLQVFPTTH